MRRYIDPATYGINKLDVPPIPTLSALVMGVLDYPPEASPGNAAMTQRAVYEAGARLRLQVRRELIPYAVSFSESPESISDREAQVSALYNMQRYQHQYQYHNARSIAGANTLNPTAALYRGQPMPLDMSPKYAAHHDTLCGFGGLATEEWFSRTGYLPDGAHVTRHMESGIETSGSMLFMEMCRWAFKRVSNRIENVRAQRARDQEALSQAHPLVSFLADCRAPDQPVP